MTLLRCKTFGILILGGIKRNATSRTGLAGSSTLQNLEADLFYLRCRITEHLFGPHEAAFGKEDRDEKGLGRAQSKPLRNGLHWDTVQNDGRECKIPPVYGVLLVYDLLLEKELDKSPRQLIADIKNKNYGAIKIFLI